MHIWQNSNLAYKLKGNGDAAQREMEEVGRELRGDDEELRVRFRKDSKSEGDHGAANIVVEIMPTEAERNNQRSQVSSRNSYGWTLF